MELVINGKTYSFKFGVKFMAELDKLELGEVNGIKFGVGFMKHYLMVQQYDIEALIDILMIGNKTESPKLKQDDLIEYLEAEADIDSLIKEIVTELEEGNVTKGKIKALKEAKGDK